MPLDAPTVKNPVPPVNRGPVTSQKVSAPAHAPGGSCCGVQVTPPSRLVRS
jgi:hypothetical protein